LSEEEPAKPARRKWQSAAQRVRLDKDQAARQGTISSLAFLRLGRDAALTFLNTDNAELGGRPLDLAMATREGYVVVEAAILAAAAPPS